LTPEQLSELIAGAVATMARRNGFELSIPENIVVERPKNRDHGDWATNIAMQLSKQAGKNPREFAQLLIGELEDTVGISSLDVAGPGFVNIFLETASAASILPQVVEAGDHFGSGEIYTGQKLNLEFVSANPTGPIHLGGTRWAALGDSLARILQFQGAQVTREYYFNDHGAQIDRFARSLYAAAKGLAAPEDGYGGEYIAEISNRVVSQFGEQILDLAEPDAIEQFRAAGVELMFEDIKSSLAEFGVVFDVYFHENSLHESNAVERAITRLRENGHIYDKEGAVWLRSTEFGDDSDRVVIKSDGDPAYIAGDLAYYLDKRERGFDRAIIMLGADHHGYVQRMMAMCAAFGDIPGENLEILIGQMVNLVKDGSPVRMSKRAGTVVTMEDLVDAVGVDAARYALTRSSANSNLDVDLDLLSKKTNDNPVFYVQYAHARTIQVENNARSFSISTDRFDPALLDHATENELIAKIAEFQAVVKLAAENREPHRIARYLEELAGNYHRWYDACRVTPLSGKDVEPVHDSRLLLNRATTVVLANGLRLLGVNAPERM
jgi:arginyl-tRNA synthetase